MISLVWRTDVHLSDTTPVSRKDDWTETVIQKLGQVASIAQEVQAVAVLDGGDFFHVKSPGRNTHDLVRKVADLHKTYPCPVYANIGNHDCVYGDYSYIGQQPLGVLFSTGVFRRCYDEHEVVFEQDGLKVRVVGVPYHGTVYDLERFRNIKKGNEDFLVCMAHVLASSTGGSMFEGEDIIKYSDLEGFDPDIYCFGHWHKDQGVAKVGRKTVVNIGSLTRGALSQDEMNREPGVAVLRFEKGRLPIVEVVRLKVTPAAEVFDVAGRERAETRTLTMDAFVDSIREKLVLDQNRSVSDLVTEMTTVPVKVRERVLLYLEKADNVK